MGQVGGRQGLIYCWTSLSKHLIDGVSWVEWEVSKLLTEDFCGRGIITADFKQGGMVAAFRDRLKIFCGGFCEGRTAFL